MCSTKFVEAQKIIQIVTKEEVRLEKAEARERVQP
jgi:hypothetical protein